MRSTGCIRRPRGNTGARRLDGWCRDRLDVVAHRSRDRMGIPHSKAFEHRDDEPFTGDNHDSLVTVVPVLETKADVNFTEVGDIAITLANETFEGLKRVVALECEF